MSKRDKYAHRSLTSVYLLIDYQDQAAFLIRGPYKTDEEVFEVYAAYHGFDPDEMEAGGISINKIKDADFDADGLLEIVSW
jgi:hypothetical protein